MFQKTHFFGKATLISTFGRPLPSCGWAIASGERELMAQGRPSIWLISLHLLNETTNLEKKIYTRMTIFNSTYYEHHNPN
jgi:hypothetical protein